MEMHPKPERWYCDRCGQPTVNSSNGYVVWYVDSDHRAYRFQIIHKSVCDRRDAPSSQALVDFLGTRGVVRLLAFLSRGPVFGPEHGSNVMVADMDEFVDFFRRCQTPRYEEARRLFRVDELRKAFHDSNESYPYMPDTLADMCRRYRPD